MKNPEYVKNSANVKKVDVARVPVTRFIKVASDIALARITLEKTSAGISQAPGPMPILKKARYAARAMIPTAAFKSSRPKVAARTNSEIVMPKRMKKKHDVKF